MRLAGKQYDPDNPINLAKVGDGEDLEKQPE